MILCQFVAEPWPGQEIDPDWMRGEELRWAGAEPVGDAVVV